MRPISFLISLSLSKSGRSLRGGNCCEGCTFDGEMCAFLRTKVPLSFWHTKASTSEPLCARRALTSGPYSAIPASMGGSSW